MTTRSRAARVAAVTRVLLALAVAVLLAMLAHDFLLPRLAAPSDGATGAASATAPAASGPTGPASSASSSPAGSASSGSSPTGPASSAPALSVTPTAPAVAPDAVRAAVAPALDGSPGVTSAEVRDAVTGEVLYARRADTPRAPASALKVLTGVTAVDVLGADRTLTTSVVAVPREDGVTELVLVGGGDVLLGTGASDPSRVDGRAGLRTLARETASALAARGVAGPVVVTTDLRLVADDGRNPAWSDALVEGGFISPVQPLATYGGREQPGVKEERVADPAAFAARTFQSELADAVATAGADVQVRTEETVPATAVPRADVLAAEPVAQVESATVGEQVGYMLAHSENQVAEALARVAAAEAGEPATDDGAAALLEQHAAQHGVDTAGMALVDASGLSGDDRMTAHQLAALVVAVRTDPALAPVLEGLPEPGQDSTLAERFQGTAAAGAVSAKTGTLEGTVSLTGVVRTTEGRELAFSMIASELDWRLDAGRAAIDAAVTGLAGL